MEQQIHFCTTHDGVRIAYAAVGQGPPLLKAANWLSHLEWDWQSPNDLRFDQIRDDPRFQDLLKRVGV